MDPAGSCASNKAGWPSAFPDVQKRAALSQNLLLQTQSGGQFPSHLSRFRPVQSSGDCHISSLEITPRALCRASSKEQHKAATSGTGQPAACWHQKRGQALAWRVEDECAHLHGGLWCAGGSGRALCSWHCTGFNVFPGFAQKTEAWDAAAGKRAREGKEKEISTCSPCASRWDILAEGTRGTSGQLGCEAGVTAPLPKFCAWAFPCTWAESRPHVAER